jgi:hypothetical protein
LLSLFVLFSASADARPPRVWPPRPVQPAFSFRLEDHDGRSLPVFRHQGATFIWGNAGERFAVRVHNPTAERVEAVLSVDGRDAVSGDVADFAQQRGYVIAPFSSVLIEGFRSSHEEVRAFRFARPEQSYSARRGTPENTGVIGVAFFRERRRAPAPIARRDAAPSKRAAPRSAESGEARADNADRATSPGRSVDNLGTAYGERRVSLVVEVSFEREHTRPTLVTTARYDDRDGLVARGIDVSAFDRRVVRRPHDPKAFPVSRFAEPP